MQTTHNPSLRQHEIIKIAGKLINELGLKGLTTKNLARYMQFSEGAIYRHFKTKEDIVVMLINELYASMRMRLQDYPKNELSIEQNLKEIFTSHYKIFNNNKHFVIAIMAEGLIDETPAVKQAVMQIMHYKQELLTQLISQGKVQNQINAQLNTQWLVHILMGSFRLHIFKWKLSGFNTNLHVEGLELIKEIGTLITIKQPC